MSETELLKLNQELQALEEADQEALAEFFENKANDDFETLMAKYQTRLHGITSRRAALLETRSKLSVLVSQDVGFENCIAFQFRHCLNAKRCKLVELCEEAGIELEGRVSLSSFSSEELAKLHWALVGEEEHETFCESLMSREAYEIHLIQKEKESSEAP